MSDGSTSAANAAHLLVAVMGVHFGFEPDAIDHCLGNPGSAQERIASRAKDLADGNFAAFKQA
jgi:hypothetical protein